jgi:hypothetical protein
MRSLAGSSFEEKRIGGKIFILDPFKVVSGVFRVLD